MKRVCSGRPLLRQLAQSIVRSACLGCHSQRGRAPCGCQSNPRSLFAQNTMVWPAVGGFQSFLLGPGRKLFFLEGWLGACHDDDRDPVVLDGGLKTIGCLGRSAQCRENGGKASRARRPNCFDCPQRRTGRLRGRLRGFMHGEASGLGA